MSVSVRVPVNPDIIRWAAHQARDPEALLEKNPQISQWIEGTTQPTWKQLQDFARKVGTPFGYFFLEELPDRTLPIADFREGFGPTPHENSPELWATLNICVRRQDWYKDHAEDLGLEPISVIGIAANWDALTTAAHMRRTLSFEVQQRIGDTSAQRSALITKFEELGGLTVFNSMVNDNVHRKLDPQEFRGFSLVDPIAPLIFVNTAQTMNGQLFTFAHELAYVWRGQGGLGNAQARSASTNVVEKWCNDVASEFLVPAADLALRVAEYGDLPLSEQLERLANIYRCGTLVVLNGLHRIGRLNTSEFQQAYERELKRLKALIEAQSKKGGQLDFSRRFRIGESFSHAVIGEVAAWRLAPTRALELTGIKSMSAFDSYAAYMEGRG